MEDYCSFEQCVRLKELGFDWECNHVYKKDFFNQWIFFHCLQDAYGNHNQGGESEPIFISAPTLSQAQKWLREKGYIILIYTLARAKQCVFYWKLYNSKGWQIKVSEDNFDTYEQSLSAGIDRALELLK